MKFWEKGMNCIRKAFSQLKNACVDFHARSPKMARALLVLFTLIIGISGGVYVYAKYYSVSAREGIAIATGVYFTANYASSAMVENSDGTTEPAYVESIVDGSYKGTDTSYIFEIRNYENNLLFNTSNVNIPYTVEFWLGEETTDATYKVTVDDTEYTLGVGDTSAQAISGQVDGGAAIAKEYKISVDVANDSGHTPVPVYVRVKTLDGSLINRTLTGKMLLTSTGTAESYIDSMGFVVSEEANTDTEKFAELQSLAAFTYEIRTAGTVTTGELTEKLIVSWNTNVLQIDLFDEAYLSWLKDNSGGLVIDSNGWCSIEIEAMPYSAESIGFFRGASFDTIFPMTNENGEEVDTSGYWGKLHEYITVEKRTE